MSKVFCLTKIIPSGIKLGAIQSAGQSHNYLATLSHHTQRHTVKQIKGYILMVPMSLPTATSDWSTSYDNEVG